METASLIDELKKQLKFKDFELNSILEITKGINTNQSVDSLLYLYEFILKEKLQLHKFILFKKKDEKWGTLIKSGVKKITKELNIQNDLERFTDITMIESSSNKTLAEFNAIIPVIHKKEPLAYLLLKNKEKGKTVTPKSSAFDDLSFIQTLTNIIVVAIENKQMNEQKLLQERLKNELEVASEMQRLLFPMNLPSDHRLDLAAQYIARHKVGGDYYDFIPLNKHEFIICIADVSGKGVGAAMLMANFQAILRTLLSVKKFKLKEFIHELNQKVMETAKGEKFITFFIAHYNAKNRLLRYVNAGHNHPILTNGKKVTFLDKGSIGLGMLEEIPFLEPDEITLAENSTLILYTDGVVELRNKSGEFFETNRLVKLVHNFYPLKMEDLNNLIFAKLDEFRQSEELVDDTAIFSCRIF